MSVTAFPAELLGAGAYRHWAQGGVHARVTIVNCMDIYLSIYRQASTDIDRQTNQRVIKLNQAFFPT